MLWSLAKYSKLISPSLSLSLHHRVALVSVVAPELLELRVTLVSLAATASLVCLDPR
jgi:hypothetical protein